MFVLIEHIASWAVSLIKATGYAGLFLAMALESAGVPIPSEVVVPFGGYLASTGRFEFWPVVLVTTFANLIGAGMLYFIGYYFGTFALHKYGKYVLIHDADIKKMDAWLQKRGGQVAFFSRLLPGTRTFSSLIIGAGEIKFRTFLIYTFIGSFLWNLPWTYLGFIAGEHWDKYRFYIRKFDYLIVAIILILIVWYIYLHIKRQAHAR